MANNASSALFTCESHWCPQVSGYCLGSTLVLRETEIRLQECQRDSKMDRTGSWPTVPKPRRHSLKASWNLVFSRHHALPMYRTVPLEPRKPITEPQQNDEGRKDEGRKEGKRYTLVYVCMKPRVQVPPHLQTLAHTSF